MSQENKTSIKTLREELLKLDEQITSAKNLQDVLAEEKKPIYRVYEWEAPERVFETKDKKWYLAVSSVALVVVVFSLLTDNYILVVAIVALILLLYALNSTPPQIVNHEITNKGVSLFSKLYPWKNINTFWISKRGNHEFLNFDIEVKKREDPDRLIVLVGEADLKKIVSYLTQFIDYLSETEINNNFFNRVLQGEIQPLSRFIDTPDQ